MRLFIAIRFSPEVRSSLLDSIAQLKQQSISGNFTYPENLHLTLAFIGETNRLCEVQQAMESINFRPFSLTLSGTGNFGDLWWAGIRRSSELEALVRQLRDALEKQGVPFDRKPFRAHITLARRVDLPAPPAFSEKPVSMTVGSISLMQSERVSGKLIYRERFVKRAAQNP